MSPREVVPVMGEAVPEVEVQLVEGVPLVVEVLVEEVVVAGGQPVVDV